MPPSKPKVVLTCATCEKTFERHVSQVGPGKGRFCSTPCFKARPRTGTSVFCAMCDTEFYRHLSEQDIGKTVNQFCTRTCHFEWRALHRKAGTYPKVGPRHAHRITAEQALGRPLMPDEVVHHIDLDKHNAALVNLAVFPDRATHNRCHAGGMSDDELRRYALASGAPALTL